MQRFQIQHRVNINGKWYEGGQIVTEQDIKPGSREPAIRMGHMVELGPDDQPIIDPVGRARGELSHGIPPVNEAVVEPAKPAEQPTGDEGDGGDDQGGEDTDAAGGDEGEATGNDGEDENVDITKMKKGELMELLPPDSGLTARNSRDEMIAAIQAAQE